MQSLSLTIKLVKPNPDDPDQLVNRRRSGDLRFKPPPMNLRTESEKTIEVTRETANQVGDVVRPMHL